MLAIIYHCVIKFTVKSYIMQSHTKIEEYNRLVENIRQIVASAQNNIAKTLNKTMVFTYWNIGKYIVEYEQSGEKRAKYGT